MLAGLEDFLRGLEVAIVRRGDAGEIDAGLRASARRRRRRQNSRSDAILLAGRVAVLLGPACRFATPRRPAARRQSPNAPVVDALAMGPLEEGPVGFVENHPHADHAGTEGSGHGWCVHGSDCTVIGILLLSDRLEPVSNRGLCSAANRPAVNSPTVAGALTLPERTVKLTHNDLLISSRAAPIAAACERSD